MAATHVLLVEGVDDMNLFVHLLRHAGIPISEPNRDESNKIKIVDGKGYENLRRRLPTRLKGSELQRLGIVADADSNIAARWDSLRQVLSDAGYIDLPSTPDPGGTIVTTFDLPTIGVWLMPDNLRTGMIEDFARSLVAADDALWPHVDPCLQGIPISERRWNPLHQAKVEIHTWLAWQEEPGTPIGQAITKRYLDANALPAQMVVRWLRSLFAL